jgi:hypothetical protein
MAAAADTPIIALFISSSLGRFLASDALAVPRAQVADSDPDDLRRPAWTQRRVQRRELAHH